jgi:hypothetical protein
VSDDRVRLEELVLADLRRPTASREAHLIASLGAPAEAA